MVFIGVHCDTWEEGKKAAEEDGVEYIVANDSDGKTQEAYEVTGYPTIYVIDKAGSVRYVDPPNLEETVKELLAE